MTRAGVLCAAVVFCAEARRAGAQSSVQLSQKDVDEQYGRVLAEMKHPSSTGILVTEIEPESPAGRAGLQAGDIIFHYAGDQVRTLDALRHAVAETFAASVAENEENKVLLGVHREGKEVVLQVPRAPLGIRAMEVEAAVAVPRNPPPSQRGTIKVGWDEFIRQQAHDADAFFRTNEKTLDGRWVAWEHRTFTPGADAISGETDTYRVDPATGAVVSSTLVSFRLRTGDYVDAPAFVLDSFDATIRTPENTTITTHAERSGLTLHTSIKTVFADRVFTPIKRDVESPLSGIPEAGVPLLAAAMPQQKDAALQLNLVSVRDFLSRPGYVLIARGKEALPESSDQSNTAWRVDLLHCGIVVETYWLTDDRKCFEIDSETGTTLVTRRVGTLQDASTPVTPKGTTQPATQP